MKREALALFRGAKAISTPEDLLIYDFAVIFQVELISTLNLGWVNKSSVFLQDRKKSYRNL